MAPESHELTFRQRIGLEDIPRGPYDLDFLSQETRSLLFACFHEMLSQVRYDGGGGMEKNSAFFQAFRVWWIRRMCLPIDQIPSEHQAISKIIKNITFEKDYDDILDFLEYFSKYYIIFDGEVGHIENFDKILRSTHCGYRFVFDPIPHLIAASNEHEANAIADGIQAALSLGKDGCAVHLSKATTLMREGRSSDSIRESIHAVEAACRIVAGNEKATLGEALNAIEKEYTLHTAFKKALSQLYGYTNDEEGIRHSHLQNKDANPETAQFMLGVCASFISYVSKLTKKSVL